MTRQLNRPPAQRWVGNVGSRRRSVRCLLLALLMTLFGVSTVVAGQVPSAVPVPLGKHALILVSAYLGAAATDQYVAGLITGLKKGGLKSSDIHVEHLDLARHASKDSRRATAALLLQRYANVPIDLVFCIQQPALDFLLNEAKGLAPLATVLSWTAQLPPGAESDPRQFVFQSTRFDYRGTLERALELFPRTERVIVIQGSSEVERSRAENIRVDLAPWQGKLQIEDTQALSLEEIEARLTNAPKNTVILGVGITRDAKGQIFVPPETVARFLKVAQAPFFVLVDLTIGTGTIGGVVARLGDSATQFALIAMDILRGSRRLAEQVTIVPNTPVSMFDWEQIRRWGGDASRLTGDTVFVNREPTFWEQFRFYVIGIAGFVVAQSMLIAFLITSIGNKRKVERALQKSEARSRAITQSAHDAIVTTDSAGNIVGWNHGAQITFGYTESEATNRPLTLLMPERYREQHLEGMRRIGSGGEHRVIGKTVELHGLHKDGTEFPLELSLSKWESDDGWFVSSIIRNTRDRKQAEQALRESESFKSSILDSLDAEFAIVDRNGLILDVNGRWQQFSLENCHEPGKPAPRTDVGTNYLAVCAVAGTDGGLEASAGIQSVLGGCLPRFRLEYRCDSPQRQRWFLMTVMPLGEDAKDGAVIMHTDISERKQAQAVDAFLAQAGSSPDAEPFFDALARFLAQSLQMDYICIDRLEGDKLNATTLAVWHNGQFEDNLTYALCDTPCGDVVGQKVCCFPASVRQFFPNDTALQELHAESYIGVTLWSHTGQPIGLIAVIGRRELSNRDLAESTLARVVVRASGELERLNAEAAMHRSETRFRGVFEKSYAGIAVADATGTLLEVNDNLARMLEYEHQELIGMNIARFTHADDLATEMVYLNEMRTGQRDEYRMNKRYLTRTGTLIWVDLLVTVVRNLEGNAVNVIGLVVDIGERMKAEAKLQLAANVFSHAREGIVITDASGTIIDINEAFTRITGYGREEVLGRSPSILRSDRQDNAFYEAMWRALTEHGHWSGEIWNRRQDGETYAELLTISSVRDADGAVQQYVGLFSDITAIKQHQSQLEHIAHFDALTSLPNRVLLADRLQQAMAQAQRREHHLAVVYLDLDGFKAINDRHGHDAGDQVLITLAQRLKKALREGDSLARLGGDEFVAVLIDLEDQLASRSTLTRLLAACSQRVRVGQQSLQVSASLGVTFYPQRQDIDADQLLRQADQAMYQAKLAGKNRYHFFDAEQDSSIRGRHESVERIRLALDNHEFVLHYQPKVNMRSGQIVGAEALIRWQHPEKGLLAPALFLPVIEDHALAVSIGEWVIDTALTQMELWREAGLEIAVSVNIGARQLQQSDFVDRLKVILAKHPQVKPARLELEVLETSALEDITQVSDVIEACAQIGVTFALDDFGTGYSSLTYLKRLRVAMLKIDQSFVRDMLEDPADWAILQGIIGMAAAFKRDVIAEGVETTEHGSLLLQLGCQLAQGYGIARPMPAAQMPKWATEWQPDATWYRVLEESTSS